MRSSVSGDRSEPFFKNQSDGCSCSEKNAVFPTDAVTSLDYSSKSGTRLFWTARTAVSYPVWSSDLEGCDCKVEFIPSDLRLTGNSKHLQSISWNKLELFLSIGGFSSMTVDSRHLIWSDAKYGRVFKLNRPINHESKAVIISDIGSRMPKSELFEHDRHNLTNVRKVVLLSSSVQPLPSTFH